MEGTLLLFTIFAAFALCSAQLMVDFHVNGVMGNASITWHETNKSVTIRSQLSESLGSGQIEVQIRTMWVYYDVMDKCDGMNLGEVVDGMHTRINSLSETARFDNVPSEDYLEGMSLVLKSDSKTVCGSIMKSGQYTTAVAQFDKGVFGSVYFRQHSTQGNSARIVSNLATGEGIVSAMWKISDTYDSCTALMNAGYMMAKSYNPGNINETISGCDQEPENCTVGDLTGRFGNVRIEGMMGEKSMHGFRHSKLSLNGSDTIDQKLLILNINMDIFYCAKIQVFDGRKAMVSFNHDGITGSITFQQASPFDSTSVSVNVQGLKNGANGYHVHVWPTPTKVTAGQQMCSAAIVAGHFNPYGKNPSDSDYPTPDSSTDDMYEIGDLSAKFGTMANMMSLSGIYSDWNLPLYGKHSIIGRSLVIHRNDAANSRWVCANIEPEYSTVVAVATFRYPVIGQVMFMQEEDQPMSDTAVFGVLDYRGASSGEQGYHIMVNSHPAGDDMLDKDESMRCMSTKMVFNPLNLNSDTCSVDFTGACAVGDITGRTGMYFKPADDSLTRVSFTDVNLPLSGKNSILGKSLVISNGTHIVACANIEHMHDPKLEAQFTSNGIGGSVSFQQMAGFGATHTMITNNLTGVMANHRLRIHELPPAADNSCSNLGNVFNPLGVTTSMGTMTDDDYKVGDLTHQELKPMWMNYNLPLKGLTSIIGRSLVVVNNVNGEVVSCAKIMPYTPDSSMQRMATATFSGGVSGMIKMSQQLFGDGTVGDTSVSVELTMGNQNSSVELGILTNPAMNNENCDGVQYNPFMTDSSECMPTYPLHCPVGDLSGKLAMYMLGGGKKVFTDADLPITGMYSVQGRPFVVTMGDNKYCASIVPANSISMEVEINKPSKIDISAITRTYTSALSENPGDIVVEYVSTAGDITTIRVHFVGNRKGVMKEKLDILFNRKLYAQFTPYQPFVDGASHLKLSLGMMLGGLIVQLFMHV